MFWEQDRKGSCNINMTGHESRIVIRKAVPIPTFNTCGSLSRSFSLFLVYLSLSGDSMLIFVFIHAACCDAHHFLQSLLSSIIPTDPCTRHPIQQVLRDPNKYAPRPFFIAPLHPSSPNPNWRREFRTSSAKNGVPTQTAGHDRTALFMLRLRPLPSPPRPPHRDNTHERSS